MGDLVAFVLWKLSHHLFWYPPCRPFHKAVSTSSQLLCLHPSPISIRDQYPVTWLDRQSSRATARNAAALSAPESAADPCPIPASPGSISCIEGLFNFDRDASTQFRGLLHELLGAEVESPRALSQGWPDRGAPELDRQNPGEPAGAEHFLVISLLSKIVREQELGLLTDKASVLRLVDQQLLNHAEVVGQRPVQVERQRAHQEHHNQGYYAHHNGDQAVDLREDFPKYSPLTPVPEEEQPNWDFEVNNQCMQTSNRNIVCELNKGGHVVMANACSSPRTVVIHPKHTPSTIRAMMGSGWLITLADFAELKQVAGGWLCF
mmetsp:Transcript_62405/g.136415  ORF Transcript_62405/g.136415 Transcript_62405/m.136415 type:complete len:320 (-) Transcript_62405:577-1536(-)